VVEIDTNERREGKVGDLQKNELRSRQILTWREKEFSLFLKLWRKHIKLEVSSRQRKAYCNSKNQSKIRPTNLV
jgi:hypothetical protein